MDENEAKKMLREAKELMAKGTALAERAEKAMNGECKTSIGSLYLARRVSGDIEFSIGTEETGLSPYGIARLIRFLKGDNDA